MRYRHGFPHLDETRSTFFYGDEIHTTVVTEPHLVDSWIYQINNIHRNTPNLIVGLDVEWRPNFTRRRQQNPVAVLQLCVGCRCLIFQILHSPYVPESLSNFLNDSCVTLAGVGIHGDLEKLQRDYSIEVTVAADVMDLGSFAAESCGDWKLRNLGLKRLTMIVLGKELDKPHRVTTSRWDNETLSDEQVEYACIDAFVSCQIGRTLMNVVDD